ncbi:hypothetical protein [uncultured Spirosoma sp.]|uniref:hypothetical protein n=1 Tax=uncultured Spirosoma sp. TaxID=278208 RepID=UPI00258C07CB|nr:hypothetical protein [uncultured Spirosoma sp.]
MIRFILATLFLPCLLATHTYAQETIYLANGNRSIGKLTGAEGEKIKITVNRNGKLSNYSLRRENVLLAFAEDGRYLIVSALDDNPVKAQQAIDAFNQETSPRLVHDLLIKVNPPTVIPGLISYESDEVVNYKSPAGAAASINKHDLAAIFYRDGRHRLLVPSASVVTALNSTRADFIRLTSAPAQKPTKAPVAKVSVSKQPAARPVAAVAKPVVAIVEASPKAVPPAKPADVKPTLSDAQYQQYRQSALNRVDEFVAYLNIITNKDLDDDKKDKAIKEATALFMPDATIDVTSSKRPGVRKYKIETYLTNLKLIPYASTSIEWTEIQYVSELTQAADGNYYGLITGQQTFTGYAENGQDVLYSDVTQKSIKVKLEAYRKSGDAGATVKWAVLLGNIGIVNK